MPIPKGKRTWDDLSAKQKKALAIGQALRLATCIEAQAYTLYRHCVAYGLPATQFAYDAKNEASGAVAALRAFSTLLAGINKIAKQEEKKRIKLLNEGKKEQES
jgi:hypothetical protein